MLLPAFNRRRFTGFVLALCASLASPALVGSSPNDQVVVGRVVDFGSGRPLAGILVAAASDSSEVTAQLAGDRLSNSGSGVVTAVTDADGTFTLPTPAGTHFLFDAFGSPQSHVTFHGIFASGLHNLGTIRLIEPTADERAGLEELNRFRGAPGGVGRYAAATRLVFDENLMESARFWAQQEVRAGLVGHSCGSLGNPPNCVEFNAFFHSLAGAPQDWFAGQNAAFDRFSSWRDTNSMFEYEGRHCAQAFNWHSCGYNDEVGHFVNIMSASRWVGLGAKRRRDAGVYYTMNLI